MSSVSRFADGDFLAFVEKFMLRNEPCVFTEQFTRDWKSRKLWQKDGRPHLEFLAREFGMSAMSAMSAGYQLSAHTLSEFNTRAFLFYTCIICIHTVGIQDGRIHATYYSSLV